MRTHRRAFLAAVLLLAPLSQLPAQDRGGIPTETQERQAMGYDPGFLWNLLGLAGLLGLLGLRRGHAEDGYHPTAFE